MGVGGLKAPALSGERDPRRRVFVRGDGEFVRRAAVVLGGDIGAVAVAGEVQQDDVARGGDAGDGVGALLVAEVARAAHDALLEPPGAVGRGLHARAVVALDGEDGDAGEALDERGRDVPDVGGEAERVSARQLEAERGDAEGVVREERGERCDAAGEFEGVVERLGAARERAPARAVLDVAAVGEDTRARRQPAGPAGIPVVGVEVGQDDGEGVVEGEAEAGEFGVGAAEAEAHVDEEE